MKIENCIKNELRTSQFEIGDFVYFAYKNGLISFYQLRKTDYTKKELGRYCLNTESSPYELKYSLAWFLLDELESLFVKEYFKSINFDYYTLND